jgi:hypothetical protein
VSEGKNPDGGKWHASKDQEAIQRPDIAKDPEFVFGIEEHTARPIEDNIDSVVVFECFAWDLKWVALKHRRVGALICRERQIEVGVLLERDTCAGLVTVKVPKDFRQGRTGTEIL